MTIDSVEGFVPFRGLRTWYRIVGELAAANDGRLPLVLLRGGPGFPSDAFEPLEALARSGRPVVRYDQIGCGRSDRRRDPSCRPSRRSSTSCAMAEALAAFVSRHPVAAPSLGISSARRPRARTTGVRR